MIQLKSIKKGQRGDFLIEALIGVLLMGIVGAGVTFVTSRVSVSQKNMAMQEITIGKLRGLLLTHGSEIDLCAPPTAHVYLPNDEALRVEIGGCDKAVATVAGVEIPGVQTPIVLTVHSASMGTIRVGGNE